jgi:glycosyltransferase involved in cell wall biosynthesis
VAFLAGYEHTPNLDAVGWLLREIMPLVWQSLPDLPCVLAGSDMPEALRRFDDTRVIALGEVAELDTVFQRVRLTVAPLRFGAGVKAKVLDSLAAGVPCVCTGVAAEGLDFRGALSALRGDTAAELAARIVSLHEDRDGLGRLSQAGQMLIWQNHSPAEVDRRLAEAIGPQHLPMGQQGRRAWA